MNGGEIITDNAFHILKNHLSHQTETITQGDNNDNEHGLSSPSPAPLIE